MRRSSPGARQTGAPSSPADRSANTRARTAAAPRPRWTRVTDVPGGCGRIDRLIEAMAHDKKVKDGGLPFILARGIGRSFIARGIERDAVHAFLTGELSK